MNTQLVSNKFALVSMTFVVAIWDWLEYLPVSGSHISFFFGGGGGGVGRRRGEKES